MFKLFKKKKGSKGKKHFKKHFRFNFVRAKGHPTYVYKESGNKYHYVGITHAKKTRGQKNIKLKKNPNKKDSRDSYIRPKTDTDKIKNFSKKPMKNLKFSYTDKKKVSSVINSSKKHKKK